MQKCSRYPLSQSHLDISRPQSLSGWALCSHCCQSPPGPQGRGASAEDHKGPRSRNAQKQSQAHQERSTRRNQVSFTHLDIQRTSKCRVPLLCQVSAGLRWTQRPRTAPHIYPDELPTSTCRHGLPDLGASYTCAQLERFLRLYP